MSGYSIREALRGFAVLVFLGAIAFVGLRCMAGCKPVDDPSSQMQAVVPALARGVKAADGACASLARAKMDADLARDCAFAYDAARLSLQAADDALDADVQTDVPCQVAQALAYARQMAGLIEKHGGKLPRSLTYALTASLVVSEVCRG